MVSSYYLVGVIIALIDVNLCWDYLFSALSLRRLELMRFVSPSVTVKLKCMLIIV